MIFISEMVNIAGAVSTFVLCVFMLIYSMKIMGILNDHFNKDFKKYLKVEDDLRSEPKSPSSKQFNELPFSDQGTCPVPRNEAQRD